MQEKNYSFLHNIKPIYYLIVCVLFGVKATNTEVYREKPPERQVLETSLPHDSNLQLLDY